METHDHEKRRAFLRQSILALGAAALPPGRALAQLPQYRRLDWQTFRTTPQYSSLRFGIGKMIANTNPTDPNSWGYWINVHQNYCPHGIAYFLAWHRGYLYYFERQLRAISGDPSLVLPYWDYYSNPSLPAEFTNPSVGNPLWSSRLNTNVRAALTMAPFSAALVNFQRSTLNAYETSLESAPHNPVHDIIGSAMATMRSPADPIFWLHHANIDRLWVAWVAAGGGRAMPARSAPYWSGSFRYSNALAMNRLLTYSNRSSLNYYYQAETIPGRLPGLAAGGGTVLARPGEEQELLSPPAVGPYALSQPRATSDSTFSTAGSLGVGLDERSVSAQLPVSAEYGYTVAQIARGSAAPAPGSTLKYRSVELVLDEVELTDTGRNGGYFYRIYLNLPGGAGSGAALTTRGPAGSSPASRLVGTLGPFRVAAAAHHHGGPAQLRYPVTRLLAGVNSTQVGMMTVSFVRVSGENSPGGQMMGIGEARIELSTAT